MTKIIFLFIILVLFNLSAIFNIGYIIGKYEDVNILYSLPIAIMTLWVSDMYFIRYIRVKIMEYKEELEFKVED
jgi:uncharacterized membrane-anchored protein YitT (DUF2179 family)